VPAAAVSPAPVVYVNAVAVEVFVAGEWRLGSNGSAQRDEYFKAWYLGRGPR